MISLIRNKYFLILWLSQISSLLTINILNFLVIVQIYEATKSTIASSLVWIAYALPAILVGPIAAAIVDITDRRKLIIAGNFIQALTVFVYAFVYHKFLYLSYAVIIFYSLIDQLYVPAETATLVRLVPSNQLQKANNILFVTQQVVTVLAFGLAGFANELIGFKLTAFSASIFLFIGFIGVLFLPRERLNKQSESKPLEDNIYSFLLQIKQGFDYIWKNKSIFYPFMFLVWLQVTMSIMVVNLPAIASQIVQTKPSLSGLLVVLPAGAGSITGSVLLMNLHGKRLTSNNAVRSGLLLLTIAFFSVTGLMPLLPFWIGRFFVVTLFYLVGIGFIWALVPTLTHLQLKTPLEMVGRVFGNFWFMTNFLSILPLIFSAVLTEVLGVRIMLLCIGIIAFLFFLAITKHETKFITMD